MDEEVIGEGEGGNDEKGENEVENKIKPEKMMDIPLQEITELKSSSEVQNNKDTEQTPQKEIDKKHTKKSSAKKKKKKHNKKTQ